MKVKLTVTESIIVDVDDTDDYQNWEYYDFLDCTHDDAEWEVDHWEIEEVEE